MPAAPRSKLLRRLGKAPRRAWQLLLFLWYHKLVFAISGTRFDISFTVFRESFLDDQYRIRRFVRGLGPVDSLLFLDIGRNHGFVLYYLVEELTRRGPPVGRIRYVGCDPAPLKFVYHPRPPEGTEIAYRLIDRAVVFDGAATVRLKYGERNLGNFNVSGSNFEARMARFRDRFEFVEIEVDTISAEEILGHLADHESHDAVIVKIDCKNRTEQLMLRALERLEGRTAPWLVACERDASAAGALDARTLAATDPAVAAHPRL